MATDSAGETWRWFIRQRGLVGQTFMAGTALLSVITGRWTCMLLGGVTGRFAHGLLIVAAPESRDPHEDWDPRASTVHAGPDSLYISVQQEATGPVTVTCIEVEDEEDRQAVERSSRPLQLLFEGTLGLPSESVELYDPNQTIRLVVPVSQRTMAVTVYGDDYDESATLLVVLRGCGSGDANRNDSSTR
jgi:hypothetical protein